MTFHKNYLEIQGTPLYYEVHGQGTPLLLIHAGVADSRMWDDQLVTFLHEYRVIRYDMRGFGKSALPSGQFSYHEDIRLLLDHLEIEQVHIIALSFGARNAVDFALAYPARVRSLVLGAPAIGGSTPSENMMKFAAEEENLLAAGDLHAAAELNVRMWVDGPNRTPEQVDATVRDRVRQMQYEAFQVSVPDDCEPIGLVPPAIDRLHEITAPTLVMIGDQDVESFQLLADKVAATIPDAQKVVMPDVAHVLNMEAPQGFSRLVLEFLANL